LKDANESLLAFKPIDSARLLMIEGQESPFEMTIATATNGPPAGHIAPLPA
jgi:hypothetical protein